MKCSFMSKAFPREQKKWETNSEPLSEVTCEGTPCLENTCRTNSRARSAEVMVSCVGIKTPCFDNLSTTTKMDVKDEEGGKCSIKSMEIEFQGNSGTGSCLSLP